MNFKKMFSQAIREAENLPAIICERADDFVDIEEHWFDEAYIEFLEAQIRLSPKNSAENLRRRITALQPFYCIRLLQGKLQIGDTTFTLVVHPVTRTVSAGKLSIESVGIAPFPGETFPRVVGIVQPHIEIKTEIPRVQFFVGDALEPRGSGNRIVAHVVNDKTPNWGAGFGLAVRETWPEVQEKFRAWAASAPDLLRLLREGGSQSSNEGGRKKAGPVGHQISLSA